jgi:uncharacterized protein (TIGR03067 family)
MRELIPMLLMSAIATGAAAQEPDQSALAGVWTATAAERDGAAAPDLVGHVLTFEADGFAIVGADGAALYAGTYTVDPTVTPPRIDFVQTSGEAEGQTWLGVYRLEGNALTIADNAPDSARPRPPDLAAPAGSGYVVIEFRRDSAD